MSPLWSTGAGKKAPLNLPAPILAVTTDQGGVAEVGYTRLPATNAGMTPKLVMAGPHEQPRRAQGKTA